MMGFRIIARKEGLRVRLYSCPGNDLTDRFPLIAETLANLRTRPCIIDGEVGGLRRQWPRCVRPGFGIAVTMVQGHAADGDHIEGDGETTFPHAWSSGSNVIVSKRNPD